MKKLVILSAVVMLFLSMGVSYGQDSKKNYGAEDSTMDLIDLKAIPQHYISGAFVYATILESVIEEVGLDPMNVCICNTYSQLSRIMLGAKLPDRMAERNVAQIRELMGDENTLYGLAMVAYAMELEDMEILSNATQIIKETAGEDSWEYALALFHCSCMTMDFDKYKDTEIALGYVKETVSLLENGHKESWLYPVSLAIRGWIKLVNQDETFIDDVLKGYTILSDASNNDDRYVCPLFYVSTVVTSIYNLFEAYDKVVEICLQIVPCLEELELNQTDIYISLNKNLCYAYAKKKQKKSAREYYKKAYEACVAMYGIGTKEYEKANLSSYEKML